MKIKEQIKFIDPATVMNTVLDNVRNLIGEEKFVEISKESVFPLDNDQLGLKMKVKVYSYHERDDFIDFNFVLVDKLKRKGYKICSSIFDNQKQKYSVYLIDLDMETKLIIEFKKCFS